MKKVVDFGGERRYAVRVLTCPQCGSSDLAEWCGVYPTGVQSAGIREMVEDVGWHCRNCGAIFHADDAIIVGEEIE